MCYKEFQVFLFILMNCVGNKKGSKKVVKRHIYFIVRPRDYESPDLVVTRRALQHIRASSCITVRIHDLHKGITNFRGFIFQALAGSGAYPHENHLVSMLAVLLLSKESTAVFLR